MEHRGLIRTKQVWFEYRQDDLFVHLGDVPVRSIYALRSAVEGSNPVEHFEVTHSAIVLDFF
jgi:hypothetical protein